jgi:hypothetical protein
MKPWSLGMAVAILAASFSASASLGGDAASVKSDQEQMNAGLRSASVPQYTQFEMQTPSGTLVREYVSPAGVVFAVVWNGPSLPDLRQLLGRYFARYIDAEAGGAGAGPRLIAQPDLVVHAGGHMRAFFGRALVPDLIPAGVSLDEIR